MSADNDADIEIEGDTNGLGLTKEEQAQFDQMRAADEPVVVEGVDPGAEGGDQQQDVKAGDEHAGDEDDDDGAGDGGAEQTGDQPKDGEKRRPRRVSWNTHERELTARETRIKELEAALGADKETKARLAERLEIINEAFKTKAQPEKKEEDDDPEPDSEADIFEHNKWLGRQLSKANQRIDQLSESGRVREADAVLQQSYVSDMHRFQAKEPNFTAAYNHLMTSRVIELAEYFFGKDVTAEGVQLTDAETKRIGDEIVKEERALVKGAIDAKESPSARMFRLAKARGFVPPAPQTAENGDGKQQQNGKQVNGQDGGAPGSLASQAAATGKNGNGGSVRQEIEAAKRAVADSASLSEGGGAPTISLTPERLATMPEGEFADLMDRLSPEQLALIMGGVPQH